MRGTVLVTALLLAAGVGGCIMSDKPRDRAPVTDTLALEPALTNASFPASFAIAPDGRLFYGERLTGALRVAAPNGSGGWRALPEPVANLTVTVNGETGLLGIALHPDFPREPWLYAHYVDGPESDMTAHVARFRIEDNRSVERETVLSPLPGDEYHTGGILEFGPDGNLYVSVGDDSNQAFTMVPWTTNGKILRVTPTGERPGDNPWPWSYAYSLGHRNVFGLAFHPETGVLWATENGPSRDDELNRIRGGGNYGWPLALGRTPVPGLEDPERVYARPFAPTEAAFYTGDKLPGEYRGNLFFGTWVTGDLHRVEVADGAVVRETIALNGTPAGVLDVENGPDGHLYVSRADGVYRVVAARGG